MKTAIPRFSDLPAAQQKKLAPLIERLGQEVLGHTLQEQKSDRLDFHEHGIWTLRDLIVAAYMAGKRDR
jgi:hypothetical protein